MLAGVCIGIGRDTVDVLLRRVLLGWHIVLTCIDGRRAFQRCCDGSTSYYYCLPYRHCCCLPVYVGGSSTF